MNPERQSPQIESSPDINIQGNEVSSDNQHNQERSGEGLHEQEQNIQQGDRRPVAPPPTSVPLPLPTVSVPVPKQASDDSVGPTLAADDDVIEKEWVDKAKKIITATQDDPYKREKEIGKLQADYLRKRYGKELGISN